MCPSILTHQYSNLDQYPVFIYLFGQIKLIILNVILIKFLAMSWNKGLIFQFAVEFLVPRNCRMSKLVEFFLDYNKFFL